MASIPITIQLDEATRHSIESIAATRHDSPESILREAIEFYVADAVAQEQFRLDTLASIEDFERTGLHLTGDEVDEWLTRRAAGERIPLPECHT